MRTGSILETVARHEQALVAQREAAEREAEAIIADARAQASRMREERRRQLESDIAELRRKAEAAREEWREAQRQAAQDELERRRVEAQRRAPQVIQEVMAMVLPRKPEGMP
jgi:vacuolar-type H+-ATPase subunit E/Vma4